MPLNGFLLFRLRTLLAIVTVIVDDATLCDPASRVPEFSFGNGL